MLNEKKGELSLLSFIPLFIALLIDAMGTGLVFPILSPIYMQNDSGFLAPETPEVIRNWLYGITLASYSLATFLGTPLLGDLSDQIGRKKLILLSLLGTGISFFISALAIVKQSFGLLLIGRFLSGLCAGSQAIAQAAITDQSTEKNKAINLSLITASSCIGFVIGPILGGFFSDKSIYQFFDYTTPFYIAGCLSLGNVVCLYFFFKETFYPVKKQSLDYLKGFKIIIVAFKRKDLQLLVFTFFFSELTWTLYFQYMSLYLGHTYQFSAKDIGIYMSVLGMIYALNMLVILPYILQKLKIETSLLVGLFLSFIGMLALVFTRSEIMQWVIAFPINIGNGLTYIAILTLFSNVVDKNSQGWVMGMVSAIVSLAFLITAICLGALASINNLLPFIFCSGLIFIAIIIMNAYIKFMKYP